MWNAPTQVRGLITCWNCNEEGHSARNVQSQGTKRMSRKTKKSLTKPRVNERQLVAVAVVAVVEVEVVDETPMAVVVVEAVEVVAQIQKKEKDLLIL